MKYGHLERIPVRLTVRSPLFIGSGRKLNAMEFILDEQNTVHVPSIPDMVDAFANAWQRGLSDDFMSFVTKPARTEQLTDFIRQRRISLNPPPNWISYSVKAQRDVGRINSLLTFVRNGDNQPYIPGSSIKGALRTALIAARMNEQAGDTLAAELRNDPKSRRASSAEQVLRVLPFIMDRYGDIDRKNAVNDLLRAIEISDSAPFPVEALTVCCRHWLLLDGEERASRSPVYMECVRPGTEAQFFLTVDHSLWPSGEDALSVIRQALAEWDALCHRVHQSHYERALADIGARHGTPIVLGGGTGFQRKSLIYRAKQNTAEAVHAAERALRAQFRTYKPPYRAITAPYMFKTASYEGAFYPMGMCELNL